MHSLVFFVVLCGACAAHYRGGSDTRNLIEREEPNDAAGVYVECPVCESTDAWPPSHEKCTDIRDGKRYKKCERGTYVNEVCGNRLDCYRGPGEQCSEKMRYDVYGQKCARGFYCNDVFHVCTGLGFYIDSNSLWYLNKLYRYPLRAQQDQQDPPSANSEPAVILA